MANGKKGLPAAASPWYLDTVSDRQMREPALPAPGGGSAPPPTDRHLRPGGHLATGLYDTTCILLKKSGLLSRGNDEDTATFNAYHGQRH